MTVSIGGTGTLWIFFRSVHQNLLGEISRSCVRHHLPQLLEEVLDEDESLWLGSIAFRKRAGGVLRYDEPVAIGMEIGRKGRS